MAETGYRRRESAICTLTEQEKWQKPGTGEGKVRSVPLQSKKMPEIGYRRRKSTICTLAVREAWWREVCVLIKGVCFGSIEWYCECTLQA